MLKRCVRYPALCAGLFTLLMAHPAAHAVGTDAGTSIQNTATATFDIGGVPQTPVSSTLATQVDELIDVVVVDDIGGTVAVSSPQGSALLQFTVTNTGNGSEVFRIIADVAISEGGFDPTLIQLYLETNGVPGLQTGGGGDTAYVSGFSDPTLLEDEALTVYVDSSIPVGQAQNDEGHVELRAIAETIINQAGTDDPTDPSFPVPGTAYAGFGDGGGAAVIGASHDPVSLLILTTGIYRVSAAVVVIDKTSTGVVDPFGGATYVPGSIVGYELQITVSGAGDAENLVITDVMPADLEYQAGSLVVNGTPEDDDFAPAGTDNAGFDSGTQTITVDLGTVAGGSPVISITFDAAIR